MAALRGGTNVLAGNWSRLRCTTQLLHSCRCSTVQATTDNFPKKSREFRKLKSQVSKQNGQDPHLERAARHGRLSVDLSTVHKEWKTRNGASSIRTVAKHSGIFEHVFGGAEFTPSASMDISYRDGTMVHCGNFITPSEASSQPDVKYQSDKDSLWSLLLTSPDAISPGSHVSEGVVLCDYLPPIPPQGTGYHRYVFCLLQQKTKLDLAGFGIPSSRSITSRFFSTSNLLQRLGDQLTPSGLSFFQAAWDDSVTDLYTGILGITEPAYTLKPFKTPTAKRRDSTQEVFASKYRNM